MKRGLLALISGLIAGSVLVVTVGVAAADAPPPVQPHRHYKFPANGEKVYVGPNFCDGEAAAQGFYGFHARVHVEDPGINDILRESCP
jgi:hypothetical protein